MRVLVLNGRLSERGGADRWLLGVLARLQSEVETLLAVGYCDRDFPAAEERRIGAWVRVKGLDSRGLDEVPRATADGLRRVIREFRPDVIHANDVTDPDLLQVVVDSGRGMQTVQDHRFFCPGRGKVDAEDRRCADPMGDGCSRCFDDADYGRHVLELTQRRRDALLRMSRAAVLSRYMADELIAVGVSPRRVVRIPPFVDRLPADGGDAGAGEFHLMAGRLSAHKGVRVALEAALRLRGDLPLVVAGDGPLVEYVRSAEATSEGRVRFVGWADRNALADLFHRARSSWLPALWAEPFGIVGLEAMSRGVPVIATDGGGVRDWLVDGETGFAVEPGSAVQLARAADRLEADPSLAGKMGRRGIERAARQFDARAIKRQLLDVYADVASCGISDATPLAPTPSARDGAREGGTR